MDGRWVFKRAAPVLALRILWRQGLRRAGMGEGRLTSHQQKPEPEPIPAVSLPLAAEDVWHVYNLTREGDHVTATTFRKVQVSRIAP